MKIFLTLDEALNEQNFEHVESALFELNKSGVYDPDFIPLALEHTHTKTAKLALDELIPYPKNTKVWIQ